MYSVPIPPIYEYHAGGSSVSSTPHTHTQTHSHFRRYDKSSPMLPSISKSTSHDVSLTLRQQPKEALVTTEGKEKARKPIDPPPIVQLHIKPQADPYSNFLQSPYLFMCTSLYKGDKDQAFDGNASRSLAGSLVSSLHRLKDVDNKDGGFFVFGDISVKVQGTFRLHFSLFDLHKDTNEVQYLGCITSEPFKVLLPKDFKGMDESTYLSRAFSDQGVRLRLRKEPRAMIGGKRPYPYGSDTPQSTTPIRPNAQDYNTPLRPSPQVYPSSMRPNDHDYATSVQPDYSSAYDTPYSNKRARVDEDVRRDSYQAFPASLSTPLPTSLSSTLATPPTAPFLPAYNSTAGTLPTSYSMDQQFPNLGQLNTGTNPSTYGFLPQQQPNDRYFYQS